MEALLDFFDPTDSQPVVSPRSSLTTKQPLPKSLPPEVEVGNVEYKLKLLSPTASRFEHLVTQMKWRLREGQGEAIYEIGVSDSGILTGLSEEDMEDSLKTLRRMAEKLGATVNLLRTSKIGVGSEELKSVCEVLVRKVPDDQPFLDRRLVVLGPMEAGKSTLLGVLTQGELDNGRGRARLNLFRHLHEIQSGRTSSISHEILGFDSEGEVVNYSTCISAEEICEKSTKVITLIDLAGHQKYMKTTIFGLTAHRPDLAVLVIAANSGVVGTACDHLGFSLALDVPTFVVVTKADLCTKQQVQRIHEQLELLLSSAGCKKIPYKVTTESDAYNAAQQFSDNCKIAPIFTLSCVTGENLKLLTSFLNTVPPPQFPTGLQQYPSEFHVDEIFNVPEVGLVLGGILSRGVVRVDDPVLVGPSEDGQFVRTTVATIRRNRTPCCVARAGEAVTVTLADYERDDVRKGTVLLSPQVELSEGASSCVEFEAELFVLYSTGSGMKPGFQGTVYVASTVQNAVVQQVKQKETLAAGEKGCIHFKFLWRSEFVRVGSRVLFREGQTKAIGEVTRVIVKSLDKPLPVTKRKQSH